MCALALAVSEMLKFEKFYLKEVGEGLEVQFTQSPFDGNCRNLETIPIHFLRERLPLLKF